MVSSLFRQESLGGGSGLRQRALGARCSRAPPTAWCMRSDCSSGQPGRKVHFGLSGFWWECCECCECNKRLHSHLRSRHPQSEVGGPSHSVEKEGERAPTVLPTQQTPNLAKCHTLLSILDLVADRSWGGGGTCVSEACDPRQAFLLSTDHTHFSFLPLSLDSCPRHSLLKPPVPRPLGELEDREPGRRDGGEV